MAKIALFDSGVGGLTVLQELLNNAPNNQYYYFADTLHIPYGECSSAEIQKNCLQSCAFLKRYEPDFLIIACNTASAYCLEMVKNKLQIPVVDIIEPAAKSALEKSKTKHVLVIGTTKTIESGIYRQYLSGVKLYEKACPELTALVENGCRDTRVIQEKVSSYLSEFKKSKIDTCILGCTHFPHLNTYIQKELSENVTLIDPAKCVIKTLSLTNSDTKALHFFVTKDAMQFQKFASQYLNTDIIVESL